MTKTGEGEVCPSCGGKGYAGSLGCEPVVPCPDCPKGRGFVRAPRHEIEGARAKYPASLTRDLTSLSEGERVGALSPEGEVVAVVVREVLSREPSDGSGRVGWEGKVRRVACREEDTGRVLILVDEYVREEGGAFSREPCLWLLGDLPGLPMEVWALVRKE